VAAEAGKEEGCVGVCGAVCGNRGKKREEGVPLFSNRGKKSKEGCAYLCMVAEGRREKEVVSFACGVRRIKRVKGCVYLCVSYWVEARARMCVFACGTKGRKREQGCVDVFVT
jgi:hypothetical protein